MKTWQLQEAKAKLSKVVDSALKDGPQMITRRGTNAVVLVRVEEWERLHFEKKAKAISNKEKLERSLKYLQSAPEFDIPRRGQMRLRKPVRF